MEPKTPKREATRNLLPGLPRRIRRKPRSNAKRKGDMQAMPQKRLNRMNDALMKFVFAQQERKDVTQDFINAFFEAEGTPQIMDFAFLDRELDAGRRTGKRSQLDILGSCTDGTYASVEVQMDRLATMPSRTLFYWAWLYRRLMRGEDYDSLKRTVCINVLAFELFPKEEAPDWHNCFAILNTRIPGHMLTKHLELHFVELPKWEASRPKEQEMTRLDKWMAYFSGKTTDEEMEEIAMGAPMIQAALEAEESFLLDPLRVSAYEAAEAARRDQVARDQYVRREGMRQGKREGMEQAVLGLLRESQPLELITRVSGFPRDEILAIGRRHGIAL